MYYSKNNPVEKFLAIDRLPEFVTQLQQNRELLERYSNELTECNIKRAKKLIKKINKKVDLQSHLLTAIKEIALNPFEVRTSWHTICMNFEPEPLTQQEKHKQELIDFIEVWNGRQ